MADFNIIVFIPSPLAILFIAFFKIIFGKYFISAIVYFQIILSAVSGIYLYKTALLLFDQLTAIITAMLYAVFPLTFYWVFTLGQDTIFQCALIIFSYYFLKAVFESSLKLLILSAFIFAIAFLTKSHILLGAFLLPLVIWLNVKKNAVTRLVYIVVFTAISFACTIPFGLFTLKKYGTYALSSTGTGCHFLCGHNDDFYMLSTDPPPLNSPEYIALLDNYNYKVFRPILDTVDRIPVKDIQSIFLKEGIQWSRQHPDKLTRITLLNLYNFLMPGVNIHHYTFNRWLAALLISLPVYLLAYIGIVKALYKDFSKHSYILFLFTSILVLSVVFYSQNRFRTITLEPFYLLYAASMVSFLINKAEKSTHNVNL